MLKKTVAAMIAAMVWMMGGGILYAQKAPVVFAMDAQQLQRLQARAQQGEEKATAMVKVLVQKAEGFLRMQPVSVMDKGFTPVSGTKHDYMSQAPYFWYDSSKPDGKPYLRRDGQRNPEINRIEDHKHLDELEEAAGQLALAYFFTAQEKYAVKASALLRYWFLDEATKMNPNLNYAQGIPGVTDGRGIGLIETRSLIDIADAVGLLKGSKAWSAADDAGLHRWYAEFLQWMLTSKNGRDERAAKNNHGTWYNAQVIAYALFTGDEPLAHTLAEEAKKRIDSQITAEGKMPLELERTTALGYSTFNLVAWHRTAALASRAGTDLWQYKSARGAGIRTALDWLLPYAAGERKWEYQQINPYSKGELYELLLRAYHQYRDPRYLAVADATGQRGHDLFFDLMMRD